MVKHKIWLKADMSELICIVINRIQPFLALFLTAWLNDLCIYCASWFTFLWVSPIVTDSVRIYDSIIILCTLENHIIISRFAPTKMTQSTMRDATCRPRIVYSPLSTPTISRVLYGYYSVINVTGRCFIQCRVDYACPVPPHSVTHTCRSADVPRYIFDISRHIHNRCWNFPVPLY